MMYLYLEETLIFQEDNQERTQGVSWLPVTPPPKQINK